jgi:hypothetical protein
MESHNFFCFQDYFTDSLASEVDFVETFRVLSEELETKNRQLEDADEQLNKFYELRAKVIKVF